MILLHLEGPANAADGEAAMAALRTADPGATLRLDVPASVVTIGSDRPAGIFIDALAAAGIKASRIPGEGAARTSGGMVGLVIVSVVVSLLGVPLGLLLTAGLGGALCAGRVGDCMMGTAIFGAFLVPGSMALIGGLSFRRGMRRLAVARNR